MTPAVFIDKDGTLVEDVPYNVDPGLLRFTCDALPALRLLKNEGFKLVVVTNQPGIGLGLFDMPALDRLKRGLEERVTSESGVLLDGFYACPHAPAHELRDSSGGAAQPASSCTCRKPLPGMLLEASQELDIDLRRSWMVGDILNDIEAGHRAGCRTVMMDVGNETVWELSDVRMPDYRVRTLLEAARIIVAAEPEWREEFA